MRKDRTTVLNPNVVQYQTSTQFNPDTLLVFLNGQLLNEGTEGEYIILDDNQTVVFQIVLNVGDEIIFLYEPLFALVSAVGGFKNYVKDIISRIRFKIHDENYAFEKNDIYLWDTFNEALRDNATIYQPQEKITQVNITQEMQWKDKAYVFELPEDFIALNSIYTSEGKEGVNLNFSDFNFLVNSKDIVLQKEILYFSIIGRNVYVFPVSPGTILTLRYNFYPPIYNFNAEQYLKLDPLLVDLAILTTAIRLYSERRVNPNIITPDLVEVWYQERAFKSQILLSKPRKSYAVKIFPKKDFYF